MSLSPACPFLLSYLYPFSFGYIQSVQQKPNLYWLPLHEASGYPEMMIKNAKTKGQNKYAFFFNRLILLNASHFEVQDIPKS
jgi:hypothetical protein